MFHLSQIQEAHAKVKSGADFPQYARDLISLGVVWYDTFVSDGHAVYFGNPEILISEAKYETLSLSSEVKKDYFQERLKLHQAGGTDYMTFCQDSADSGIEKWTLNMPAGTCTYYDIFGNSVLVEYFKK